MKSSFNKYWILVSVGIIANVFIFSFLSKNLEEKIASDIATKQNQENFLDTPKTSVPQQTR